MRTDLRPQLITSRARTSALKSCLAFGFGKDGVWPLPETQTTLAEKRVLGATKRVK